MIFLPRRPIFRTRRASATFYFGRGAAFLFLSAATAKIYSAQSPLPSPPEMRRFANRITNSPPPQMPFANRECHRKFFISRKKHRRKMASGDAISGNCRSGYFGFAAGGGNGKDSIRPRGNDYSADCGFISRCRLFFRRADGKHQHGGGGRRCCSSSRRRRIATPRLFIAFWA